MNWDRKEKGTNNYRAMDRYRQNYHLEGTLGIGISGIISLSEDPVHRSVNNIEIMRI